MPNTDRRSFIEKLGILGGTGAAASLSGCMGDGGSNGEGTDGGEDGGSSSDGHSILIGSVFASGHVINEMAIEWADHVESETDGRIEITIEESFGGEEEIMEQTRIGSIGGGIIGAMWVIQYDPQNYWVESPFIFEDWEQQKRAYESEYLDDGRERLANEGNQQLIGPPVYRGYRHTSGNSAFETPSDIEGVNLRVPSLDPWVNIWDGIGANPTTVAFDELYSSLQQGVVDAQENPAATVEAASLYEVQDYYTLTRHLASTGWFTLNTDTFAGLSDDDQALLSDSLTTRIEDLSSEIASTEEEAISSLEDEGMNVVEPDRDAWLSAAAEPLEEQFAESWEPSLEEVRDI